MKFWYVGLAMVTVVVMMLALTGCSGEERATSAPVGDTGNETYVSDALSTSYTDALPVSSQLALGTMLLEETEHAVTPEQAQTLLLLWQALRSGVTAQAEVNAVLRDIEEQMTAEQLATIAAMQLTREDMQEWIQEHGPDIDDFPRGMGGDPEVRVTRQAEFGGEGGAGKGMPPGGEMPPEMATARANFESMSEEERANVLATLQASGGRPGGAGSSGSMNRFSTGILLNPLIELLTQRAAE